MALTTVYRPSFSVVRRYFLAPALLGLNLFRHSFQAGPDAPLNALVLIRWTWKTIDKVRRKFSRIEFAAPRRQHLPHLGAHVRQIVGDLLRIRAAEGRAAARHDFVGKIIRITQFGQTLQPDRCVRLRHEGMRVQASPDHRQIRCLDRAVPPTRLPAFAPPTGRTVTQRLGCVQRYRAAVADRDLRQAQLQMLRDFAGRFRRAVMRQELHHLLTQRIAVDCASSPRSFRAPPAGRPATDGPAPDRDVRRCRSDTRSAGASTARSAAASGARRPAAAAYRRRSRRSE